MLSRANSDQTARLYGFPVSTAIRGRVITVQYGTGRVAPNLIWTGGWNAQPAGSKSKNKVGSNTNYTYYTDLIMALCQDLDLGEAESIALALELKADLILMDERDGRHRAIQLGLKPVGVVGVLFTAKARGHVTKVRPLLDALRQQAGFYLGDSLYKEVLRLAQE